MDILFQPPKEMVCETEILSYCDIEPTVPQDIDDMLGLVDCLD
jgi:hypothetical protein